MQKALFFMPDISGFTQFVNDTEVEHSVHIISELLETLLDNNSLGFELAEIEGDALFMYTTKIPTYERLMAQINSMLEEFHQHIHKYDHLRICNCGSCHHAIDLKLKFIVHYGHLNFMQVKDFKKPYGKDIIQIHRLLKNQVPHEEYVLFTDSVYDFYQGEISTTWKASSDTYQTQTFQ